MDSGNSGNENRLNKFLAFHLGISRREADDLISAKKVLVNGEVAEIGRRIKPDDKVDVNGKPIQTNKSFTYIMLNKPAGYVCSKKQQGDNPTIYAILPEKYKSLKTVGRLDKDSSGLILLTDDGDFTHQMTHPSFVKTKIYHVSLNLELQPLHQQMISDFGVMLEDGKSQLGLTRLSDDNRLGWEVTMHEGRNRQIRRTFSALGYEVVKLHRLNFGVYSLGDLETGKTKELTLA